MVTGVNICDRDRRSNTMNDLLSPLPLDRMEYTEQRYA